LYQRWRSEARQDAFKKNVGATLLIVPTVGECYGREAIALIEVPRTDVCLERIEPDRWLQMRKRVVEKVAANTLAYQRRRYPQLPDPSVVGIVPDGKHAGDCAIERCHRDSTAGKQHVLDPIAHIRLWVG
jgi:hypothetical protein